VGAIRQGVKLLEHKSGLGRPLEDMDDELRDWIIDFGDSGYVVRYRFTADIITILGIRHQKEAGF
jgi:hypothetical protein